MQTLRSRRRDRSTGRIRPGAAATLVLTVAAALVPLPLSAREASQAEPGDACSDDEFRAFDYWIGEWTVRDGDGERVGSSRVSRISAGCALLEEWMPARGPRGNSINFLDPRSDTWRQTWVGGGGMVLDLEGGLEDGVMTLYGDRDTAEGPVRDRIRWIPMDDGRVEQRWDVSGDDGDTWRTFFQGFYERAGTRAPRPD